METEGVFGSQAGLALFVVHSNYLGGVQGFPYGIVTNAAKAIVGASPIVFVPRTLVRTWGTRRLPTPVRLRFRLLRPMGWKGESRGIPHLAKNERDMGHPTIPGGVG